MKNKIKVKLAVIYVSLMAYIVLFSFTVRGLTTYSFAFKGLFWLIGCLLLSVIILALIRDLVEFKNKLKEK